ncbi:MULTISPECIES: hypothetical protein [Pseudomonadaceae]|uniref:hypothetical protein n=1 Tax=Pseudomonadaceae TaxID=135621 RepID=UPI0015E3331A|nr:hypothetical protein [Stutzerimonas stutzeri]MBC8650978.1 hypothetical protein [Pseudomonas sp. MT4]QXY91078.1 hypothetical protein GYM54_05450 [Pseudomonas sp. MTM4]
MTRMTPLAAALLLAASGSVIASEHIAEISQTGINNVAEQQQSGGLQRSYITQNGTENSALTEQTGINDQESEASIDQVGSLNSATVYQIHGDRSGMASIEIHQTGVSNSAQVEQREYLGELSSTATVHQEGTGNRLDATQTWVGNQLDAVSVGQDNVIHVDQSGFSTADLQQRGSDNLVQLQQVSFGIGGGFAVVDQDGTANQADIYQVSGRYPAGDVFLQQIGDANIAEISSGDGYSVLDYRQQGVGNELYASFGGQGSSITGYSEGDYNFVDIAQVGDDNSIEIAQLGSDNRIEAYQGFHAHDALINQTGHGNQASLWQDTLTYTTNSASIIQNGNGNIANVTQR